MSSAKPRLATCAALIFPCFTPASVRATCSASAVSAGARCAREMQSPRPGAGSGSSPAGRRTSARPSCAPASDCVPTTRPGGRPTRTCSSPARPEDLLAWADEIASGIAPLTVRDSGGGPTWIGLTLDVFTGLRTLGRLGFDLLSGRAGIVRALLELARRLDRPELASLAREAAEAAAREYMEVFSRYDRSCAGHAVGVGGLVTVLAADPELRPLAVRIFRHASERRVWMRSGGDFVSGVAGWRRAAHALGESAPSVHGVARPYAPSARPRLARWLEPESTVPLCADHLAAARLRQDFSRHGSWFAESWLDDRHNLSGVDGVPALAVCFARLANEAGPAHARGNPTRCR